MGKLNLGDQIRAFIYMLRGHMVQPDPMEAEPRPGDTHSRKVPEDVRWKAAGACAERGLYGAAADWIIAATGNGTARIVEEA